MKTNKFTSILLLVTSISFFNQSHVFSQENNSGGKYKSVALVSTMIIKIVRAPIPVTQAPFFNKKTNSIAPLIIKAEEESITGYREAIASIIKKYFNCDVLFGKSLIEKQEYQDITKKFNFPDNLKIQDDNFPKVIIPQDEQNLFKFENGNKVEAFFRNQENTKASTSEICKLLGVDLIAVSYTNLMIAGYRPFGEHADLVLWTTIFFYDKDGKLVAKGQGDTRKDYLKAVGNDIMEYKTVLAKLPDILDDMMQRMIKKYPLK